MVYDMLVDRHARGRQTILYVSRPTVLAKEYGLPMSQLVMNNYLAVPIAELSQCLWEKYLFRRSSPRDRSLPCCRRGRSTICSRRQRDRRLQFVRNFVKQHQALPTPDTIEAHTGDALVKHSEPSSYYFDLLELRHIERQPEARA